MSYQVLARKYRPQTFKDVLGQEHVTQTLQNAIESKRLHHAYLFTGVRGVGKTTVARILAKALNCEGGPAVEPCNKCKSCLDITAGSNMDVQEIDGASNTGVDDVREIRERLKYLPAGGRYKIYIIDEVHMLSTAAFNALLKTLEEPPPHVIFMFATTEPAKIPATILSRCQRHDLRRISINVLADSLKKVAAEEKISVEPDAVLAIAGEAEGSMRDAQSLFDQAVAFSGSKVTYGGLKEMLGFMDRSQLQEVLLSIAEKDAKKGLKVIEDIYNQGGNLARLAEELLSRIRGLLVFSATGDQSFLRDIPSEERGFISGVSAKLGISAWEQIFKICYRQTEEILRSKYPKMAMEALIIQLTQVGELESVDQLMEKIDSAISLVRNTETLPLPRGERAGERVTAESTRIEVDKIENIPNPVQKKPVDEVQWSAFVKSLKEKRPQLASILEHGIFVGSENGAIRLDFNKGSIYEDMLKENHRKPQLEESIAGYFGGKYFIELGKTGTASAGPELKQAAIEARKERNRKLKEETLAHDVVKEATSIFEADITEIKIKEQR